MKIGDTCSRKVTLRAKKVIYNGKNHTVSQTCMNYDKIMTLLPIQIDELNICITN